MPEPDAPDRLFAAAAAGRVTLLAPEIYVGEVVSTLWKRCQLVGDLTRPEAEDGLVVLLGMLPVLVPLAPLAEQALQLALTFRRPVYDCFYLALALQEQCALVTADRGLIRAVGAATGNVVPLEEIALG